MSLNRKHNDLLLSEKHFKYTLFSTFVREHIFKCISFLPRLSSVFLNASSCTFFRIRLLLGRVRDMVNYGR